ncbi:MAG: hypothetical protein JO171_10655 [Paludibacterium sp.]|uniref:hypothetical protein n=1 Tax=Paludibacterium sp. TaxID=1917523 RepID=UPI0025D48EAB|nr:hypothetical protein [Paludibacterium sp.]MBV8047606.1 hypothetical protein [Paludibacterium sp.]MBV8648223.1 hypothetical protein [Paludibacterium sp.]
MRALRVLPLVLLLTGCNWINHVTGLSKDDDRAIGAGCRQTGRSLEECYRRNPDADKAQVYSGWREMHEYMTKQSLPTMSPPPEPPPPAASAPAHAEPPHGDNGGQPAGATSDSGEDGGKPDPEVQAVLDTINNRSNGNGMSQPSNDEQKQLQQLLKQGASSSAPPKSKKSNGHG